MIARIVGFLILVVSLYVPSNITAAEPASAEVQDVLFLHPQGLLNVRLQILRGGQGYQAAWGEFLWEIFEGLDTDGSFDLDYQEFRRGDWAQFRARNAETGYTVAVDRSFLDFDANPQDEIVTFSEVVEALGQCCCQASYGGQTNPGRSVAQDALFAALDHNENEELEAEEIAGAFMSLRQLDRNDDELYTASELQPEANPQSNGAIVGSFQFMVSDPGSSAVATVPVITPPPGTSPELLAKYVLGFYYRPPVKQENESEDADDTPQADAAAATLSREEFAIADAMFDVIDADANSQLDLQELSAWLATREADVELIVRLDAGLKDTERVEIVSPSSPQSESLGMSVEKNDKGEVRINVLSTQVVVTAAGPGDIEQQLKNFKNSFKQYDGDNNDYLDANEARQIGISGDFSRIDADNNGQLFFEEIADYRRHEAQMAAQRNDLAITNRGSTLFEIVETSGNQQLSARELSQFDQVTAGWDYDHNNAVAMKEIPRRYQLSVRPGTPNRVDGTFLALPTGRIVTSQRSQQGEQTWFDRMDRNGDGDLSPREFLGPPEDFERLDADHDQLLSEEEAAALTAD